MSTVFSIAFNGYEEIWDACIATHRDYAAANAYSYALVGQGVKTPLAMESAWVKIPLLMAAQDAGHDWILFVDADAEFSSSCPRFETVQHPDRDVYLAHGFSGRPNSGVILLRNTPSARGFLKQVLLCAGKELPQEHRVGWGENGEVIHVASTYPGFQQLDTRWNNNARPGLQDYIRHYSAGRMRRNYRDWDKVKHAMRRTKNNRTEHRPGSAEFYLGLVSLITDATCDSDIFDIEAVTRELMSMAEQASS